MRIAIAVAALMALVPFGLPPYAMTLLTEALIMGLFAMSLDLMVGYARLISFGHAAAYGFGAYAAGNFLLHFAMPLPCAVLAAGIQGVRVGGSLRKLRTGAISKDVAMHKIKQGHRQATVLLAVALLCMAGSYHV